MLDVCIVAHGFRLLQFVDHKEFCLQGFYPSLDLPRLVFWAFLIDAEDKRSRRAGKGVRRDALQRQYKKCYGNSSSWISRYKASNFHVDRHSLRPQAIDVCCLLVVGLEWNQHKIQTLPTEHGA
jgi:hypothetical protein